jgi:hypothetical protein
MMMQVGADSMNYQLRNTRTGLKTNGELDFFNCSCKKESDGYFHFVVNKADTLDHYVFTDGEHHGTWNIPNGINVALYPDSDGVCQPYFISIRCPHNGGDAQWVCETKQRKLNEDATCWYFNWGILTCDSAGVYTLTETRGNAYMYGDNIVAGKISSLAKNSWFDLTNGEFVLGNTDSGAAFSYIDGVLHIGGLPTDSDVADLLIQLGVLNSKIDNIGGKNLLKQTAFHYKYITGSYAGFTRIYNLEAGKTYIATWGKFENNADGATNEEFNGVCLGIGGGSFINTEQVVRFGEPFYVNGNGRFLNIIWCDYGYAKYMIGVDDYTGNETKTNFTQYLDYVMLQEGEVATSFQPSIDEELEGIEQLQEDFQESLNKINSDEYFSVAEKKIIRTNWEAISGLADTSSTPAYYEKNGSYGEASNAVVTDIDTTNLDTAFENLRSFLNQNGLYLEEDTNWTTTGRSTMSSYFTAYYNAEAALLKAINEAYADTKAFDDSSYRYLKEALKNDTDITNGIVATTHISLRDWTGEYNSDGTRKYKVNAGLSGLDDDNVLMWGGGDYEAAVAQAMGLVELAKQLPILLTKTGIHSKISCLEVTSPTELTIFGKDNTKIVIDGGDNVAPSISMLYNDEVYLKLSADSLAIDEIETKTIESYSRSVTLVDKKGISVGSVDIDTINFAKAKYTVSKESGTNIRAKIRILLDTSFEVELKEFRVSFDIYIGNSKFYTFSVYSDSVTAQSGISAEKHIYGSCTYRSQAKFTGGGDKTVSIRNISASSSNNTFGVHLLELTIGTGDNRDEWKDGSLMLTSDSSQFTMIGRNGMQLSSTSGLVQILTDNTNAYVQMQGLPPSDPHKQGQLWKDGDTIKISNG